MNCSSSATLSASRGGAGSITDDAKSGRRAAKDAVAMTALSIWSTPRRESRRSSVMAPPGRAPARRVGQGASAARAAACSRHTSLVLRRGQSPAEAAERRRPVVLARDEVGVLERSPKARDLRFDLGCVLAQRDFEELVFEYVARIQATAEARAPTLGEHVE